MWIHSSILGGVLYRSDDDWPEVLWNVSKLRQLWSRIRKILQREGGDQLVSEKKYQAVVQAVLLFGVEIWVFWAAMSKHMEGVHVEFLR